MDYVKMSKPELLDEIEKYKDIIEKFQILEAQYYDIVENMTEHVEREMPDGTLTYVNSAFCTYYGKEKEELIGLDSLSLAHEDDRQRWRDVLGELTPESPNYRIVGRVIKADGEIGWVESTGRGFFNKDGDLIESQDIARDITDQKKALDELHKNRNELELRVAKRTAELNLVNQELAASNNYLNSILRNISEGVIVVDKNGNVELLNPVLEEAWGKSLLEIKENFRHSILNEKNSQLSKMLNEKQPFHDAEIIIATKKGDFHCFLSGSPIEEPGGKGVIVVRNIKEVRQLVSRFSGSQARYQFEDIISISEKIKGLKDVAKQVSSGNIGILIEGESGTGKELFAQAIHNHGERSQGPFIAVNCGAIPRELIGSELFGYVDGAFTGAKKGGKAGKFELSSGGTIFLDEIGDMPFEQQVALLRVIQERNVTRIGGDKAIPIDVRIICATNKSLFDEVAQGNFRKDLYYRLNVVYLKIPPLRERREDILFLFEHFMKKEVLACRDAYERIDPQVVEYLLEYTWPGNVRELQNIIERMLYVANGEGLTAKHLPEYFFYPSENNAITASVSALPEVKKMTISEIREHSKLHSIEKERAEIIDLLARLDGNVSLTAAKMGLSRPTLYRKMKNYDII